MLPCVLNNVALYQYELTPGLCLPVILVANKAIWCSKDGYSFFVDIVMENQPDQTTKPHILYEMMRLWGRDIAGGSSLSDSCSRYK